MIIEYDMVSEGFGYFDIQNMSSEKVEMFHELVVQKKLREKREMDKANRG